MRTMRGLKVELTMLLLYTDFMNNFPTQEVHYKTRGISDHSTLVMQIGSRVESGGRPFNSFNCLASNPDFKRVVGQA